MHRLIAILFLCLPAFSQTFVAVRPDCQIFFHFTAANQTQPLSPNAGLDNRTTGCTAWSFSANSEGFTAFSVELQSAPNTASNVAGTWVTFLNQNVIAGANPIVGASTGAVGFAYVTGYNPWVRVKLLSKTGTGSVDGVAFGWSIPSAGTSSSASTDVVITSPIGQQVMADSVSVAVASDQSALKVGGSAAVGSAPSGNPVPQGQVDGGGNIITPDYCTKVATFATSGSGNTQLVAVSGSTTIRVCHIDWSGDTQTVAKLVVGTGSTCTSSADATGVFTGAGGGGFGFAMDYASPLITTAAKTLCLNLSVGSTGGGTIIYSQR